MSILSDKQIREYCYRVSTSPEPYAFTKDDGTLVSPNVYTHVRVKELVDAAYRETLKMVTLDCEKELEGWVGGVAQLSAYKRVLNRYKLEVSNGH